MLEEECCAAGVQTFLSRRATEISRTTEFAVRTDAEEFRAPVLVVATGGLSIPKIGATSFGYEVARQFGVKIQKTRPALVPLAFSAKEKKQYCDLAGVSMEIIARTGERAFREKMLVTHGGLSGPAILQASSYWEPGKPLTMDLAPDKNVTATVAAAGTRSSAALRNAFVGTLPNSRTGGWNCTSQTTGRTRRSKNWRN